MFASTIVACQSAQLGANTETWAGARPEVNAQTQTSMATGQVSTKIKTHSSVAKGERTEQRDYESAAAVVVVRYFPLRCAQGSLLWAQRFVLLGTKDRVAASHGALYPASGR